MGKNTTGGIAMTLSAIIDSTNPKNTITVYDLVKDEDSPRILKVLSNMGVTFKYNLHILDDSDNTKVVCILPNVGGATINKSYYVNPFNKGLDVNLIRQFLCGKTPKESVDVISGDISKRLTFYPEDANTVSNKIATDFIAYYKAVSSGSVMIPIYNTSNTISNYIGGVIDYSKDSVRNSENVSEISEMPVVFEIPTFQQLATQKEYTENVYNSASISSDGEDIIDEINSDTSLNGTSEFSDAGNSVASNSEHNWKNIYLKINGPESINFITIGKKDSGNGEDYINVISLDAPCLVQGVSEFYDVVGTRPPHSFKKDAEGNYYTEEDIIGRPSNNNLPIQNNEKYMYNKLVDLITVGTCIEHNALSKEMYDALPIDADSEIVTDYLKTIARQAFNVNWAHTGSGDEQITDLEESSENDNGEFTSKIDLPCRLGKVIKNSAGVYTFVSSITRDIIPTELRNSYAPGSSAESELIYKILMDKLPNVGKGFPALEEFMKLIKIRNKWAECIIKLLRFGHRKPNLLTIEGYTEKYWDINNKAISYFDGNIDNCVPVVNMDTGKNYFLESIIISELPVNNIQEGFKLNTLFEAIYGFKPDVKGDKVEFPIALVFREKFEGNPVSKINVVDIYDFVSSVKNKNASYDFGYVEHDSNGFKMSDSLRDDFDFTTVPKIKLSYLKLMVDDTLDSETRYNNYYCRLLSTAIQSSNVFNVNKEMTDLCNNLNNMSLSAKVNYDIFETLKNTINSSNDSMFDCIRPYIQDFNKNSVNTVTISNTNIICLAYNRIGKYTNTLPNDKDKLRSECGKNYNILYAFSAFSDNLSPIIVERGKALDSSNYSESLPMFVTDAVCSVIYTLLPRVVKLSTFEYSNLADMCQNVEDSENYKPVIKSVVTATDSYFNPKFEEILRNIDASKIKNVTYFKGVGGYLSKNLPDDEVKAILFSEKDLAQIKSLRPDLRVVDVSLLDIGIKYFNQLVLALVKLIKADKQRIDISNVYILSTTKSRSELIAGCAKVVAPKGYTGYIDYYNKVVAVKK
jgi:hypothetical protein